MEKRSREMTFFLPRKFGQKIFPLALFRLLVVEEKAGEADLSFSPSVRE